jgi:hypothetical protein
VKSIINFLTFALTGGIAQLARAVGSQSTGQGFDSPYLHRLNKANRSKTPKSLYFGVFVFNLIEQSDAKKRILLVENQVDYS